MERADLLIRGGRVVDPAHSRDETADIAIRHGRVAAVGQDLDPAGATEVVDASGLVVIPGIIDCHVHLASWLGGPVGHRMLARAGVVTAIDFAGPADDIIAGAAAYGAGLNVGCLEAVVPGRNVSGPDPTAGDLADATARALRHGALGLKLLGGHYPLTPEASGRTIAAANAQQAYIAFHIGTTERPINDVVAFEECVELTEGRPVHFAHINAYCRGYATGDPYEEISRALKALQSAPAAVSDSHMSVWNGTSGRCVGGVPESNVTRKCLQLGGYPETEAGLAEAIAAGYARVAVLRQGEHVLIDGEPGRAAWQRDPVHSQVSFPVNVPAALFAGATAKRTDGQFAVDVLASDGGGIPRNFLIRAGLALVSFGALTLSELVHKLTAAPARLFGLGRKGHLAEGADADVTIIDLARGQPVTSFAAGVPILVRGTVMGRGATLLTTDRGVAIAEASGLPYSVVSIEKGALYQSVASVPPANVSTVAQ